MAYIKNRSVKLLQKLKSSTFVKMNNEVYGGTGRILGPSNLAEKTLLSNSDFLKAVLPTVLGVDPANGKWQDTVSAYLYGISVDVLKGGKDLNTSLSFDLMDSKKQVAISQLKTQYKKSFKTSEELADFVTRFDDSGKKLIEEVDYVKYSTPVDNLDYFNYVYCLYHNRVANSQALIEKSPRIEFYLVTKEDIALAKQVKYKLSKEINKIMLQIDEKPELATAMYSVLGINNGDDIDKAIQLQQLSKSDPSKITKSFNDKHLLMKARIENYINKGLLKRLPNSSVVVDANDPTLVVGNTMDMCLTFFSDSKNDAIINQYVIQLKALN